MNTKDIRIDDLRENSIYDKQLLDSLCSKNYAELSKLCIKDRANVEFMEPLLYAVKNDFNTYIVFSYYSKGIQNNIELANEIVKSEPQLIQNTPIAKNKKFMLEQLKINPSLIKYADESIKEDRDIVKIILNSNDMNVIRDALDNKMFINLVATMSEINANKELMSVYIKDDSKILEFLNYKLKNDYDFIQMLINENRSVADYIIENDDRFGLNGINAVYDYYKEKIICNFKNFNSKLSENMYKNSAIMRWICAFLIIDNNSNMEIINDVVKYSIITFEKLRKEIVEKSEFRVSIDGMLELIPIENLNKIYEKLLDVDKIYDDKLEEYKDFYIEYNNKLIQYKLDNLKNNKIKENKREDIKNNVVIDNEKDILTEVKNKDIDTNIKNENIKNNVDEEKINVENNKLEKVNEISFIQKLFRKIKSSLVKSK